MSYPTTSWNYWRTCATSYGKMRAVSPVATVLVEVTVPGDDRVVVTVTAPDGAGAELDMTADQARDLVNMIGGGIRAAASRAEVMT